MSACQICPACKTAVLGAWRQELDGNYYHDKCIPFRGLLNRAESELATLRTRAERAETELERERMRLAACSVAALGYFDGCVPEYRSASLDDTLSLYENYTAAQSTIADLNGQVERLRGGAERWEAWLEYVKHDTVAAQAMVWKASGSRSTFKKMLDAARKSQAALGGEK